jgi:hypothetical protein
VVLLKNSGSILPLSKTIRSVAVIGTSAALDPVVSGGGSSAVVAPYVITPLTAIRARLGANVHVVYRPGGPIGLELDRLSDVDVVGGVALKPPTSIKAVSGRLLRRRRSRRWANPARATSQSSRA